MVLLNFMDGAFTRNKNIFCFNDGGEMFYKCKLAKVGSKGFCG